MCASDVDDEDKVDDGVDAAVVIERNDEGGKTNKAEDMSEVGLGDADPKTRETCDGSGELID